MSEQDDVLREFLNLLNNSTVRRIQAKKECTRIARELGLAYVDIDDVDEPAIRLLYDEVVTSIRYEDVLIWVVTWHMDRLPPGSGTIAGIGETFGRIERHRQTLIDHANETNDPGRLSSLSGMLLTCDEMESMLKRLLSFVLKANAD